MQPAGCAGRDTAGWPDPHKLAEAPQAAVGAVGAVGASMVAHARLPELPRWDSPLPPLLQALSLPAGGDRRQQPRGMPVVRTRKQ